MSDTRPVSERGPGDAGAAAVKNSTPTAIARSSASKSPWCRSPLVRVAPAGGRRAGPARPGTCSRYQAKSSPPRLCSVPSTASGPCARTARRRSSRSTPALVDHRRDAAGVVDLGLHAVRRDDLVDQRRATRAGRVVPGGGVQAAHGARQLAVLRDGVGRRARPRSGPRPRDSPARGSTRRDSSGRQLGDDLGRARRPGRRSGAGGRCARRARAAGPAAGRRPR